MKKHIAPPATAEQIQRTLGVTKEDMEIVEKVLREIDYEDELGCYEDEDTTPLLGQAAHTLPVDHTFSEEQQEQDQAEILWTPDLFRQLCAAAAELAKREGLIK